MGSKILRPDSKGRIALGSLAKGVSGFSVVEADAHRIVLELYVEIPAREKWLFNNKEALASVERGLEDAKAGRIVKKGSFAKYIDEESD